jgi:hypothetical protein
MNGSRLELLAERHGAALAGVCGGCYLGLSLFQAAHKPLWFDELFSLYLSTLPEVADIWRALATGLEQTPPLFYLVTRVSLSLVPFPEIGLRLPEIVATLWGAGCVFLYLRRRLSPLWGCSGVALYAVSSLYTRYRLEGRSYALTAACFATALVLWQRSGDGTRSRGAPLGLALALALAISFHYYGIFLLVPLLAAGVAPCASGRRPDLGLLLSTVVAGLALGPCIPLLHASARASSNFWSRPSLSAVSSYYADLYQEMAGPVVVVVLVLALLGRDARAARRPVPAPEGALLLATLGLPVVMVAASLVTTGAFASRYAVATIPGGVLLAVLVVARLAEGSVAGAILLTGICVATFGLRQAHALPRDERTDAAVLSAPALSVPVAADIPIVVADPLLFLPLQHYASQPWRGRLRFLVDQSVPTDQLASARRSLKLLADFIPLRLESLQELVARRTPFLLVALPGRTSSWDLLHAAPLELREVGRWREALIFEARFCANRTSSSAPATGRAAWVSAPREPCGGAGSSLVGRSPTCGARTRRPA